MATLVLAGLGSAIGGAIGGSFLGVGMAAIGQAVGAYIGSVIDQKLMGGTAASRQEGPRLDSLDVMTSQEGGTLPEIAGRVGISGQVIWAARLKEVVDKDTETYGSGKQKQKLTNVFYYYFASFAVSLGEGPIAHVGRVWADGKELDLSDLIRKGRFRVYHGNETQMPDRLIEEIEGAAPANRGTAYVVFEDLPLADFGNRVPQIKVEVFGRSGEMENLVRGVNIIPGSTEWGYNTKVVKQVAYDGFGDVIDERPENTVRYEKIADWRLSADLMQAVLPNLGTASLVVSWFGDDLRAGQCTIEPKVEWKDKKTTPVWGVGGLDRDDASAVTRDAENRPAYGSTPSDASVVAAIKDLRARGLRVVLYPFVMMDIKAEWNLPDPSGIGTQGAYPWRGRIAPEAGEDVDAEVAAFLSRFRPFILHLASLARDAGGVDAFLIGSEMVGMTTARTASGAYPFVDGLVALAADVKAILPSAKLSYAADWSEYHSHRVGGDIRFHLDPLWSSPDVDFVGIDNYMPLSDWRSSETHADLDHDAGITTPYNLDYLKSNVEGGEYFDWYYLTGEDRDAQIRTKIEDLAHGEHWIFRQKAIRDWHANFHHDRPGGVRAAAPSAWVPGSKPIWFTETGCPAVDLGANQPNVFWSPGSAESALPYYSSGLRDDYMQRQFLRATFEWWADNGGSVLDPADIQVWCWDARPWPEFPNRTDRWSDGPDWRLGHWLNGRAGAAPVAETVSRRLIERHGFTAGAIAIGDCHGQAEGYAISGPVSFRDFLQPFEVALGITAREVGGRLEFGTSAGARKVAGVTDADMVPTSDDAAPYTATRAALEDVAGAAIVRFRDGIGDYETAAVRSSIDNGPEEGEAIADSPLVLDFDRASVAADRILRTAADGRERLVFKLPRSATQIRPGVILPVTLGGLPVRFLDVQRVVDGEALTVEARSFNRATFSGSVGAARGTRGGAVIPARYATLVPLDLPQIDGLPGGAAAGYFVGHSSPWPGMIAVDRSTDPAGGFRTDTLIEVPGTIGRTIATLPAAAAWRWTEGPLDVEMYSGASFVSRPEADVLGGLNGLAVLHPGGWEVVQFRMAELIGPNRWRLSGLLRGQRGTDHLCGDALGGGARVVSLDVAVTKAAVSQSELGAPFWYRFGPSQTDPEDRATLQHSFAGVGLRPFRPCRLSALWSGGDLVVDWIRRTRALVGTWPTSGFDPVLGETSEAYAVAVRSGGATLRSATVTSPGWTYTAAMRAADGASGAISVEVAQLSETYGPGLAAEITLEV
ncbi:glycoside hydrolase/phage tail family protein [Tropicimonas sp. IMCC34043]|uniref:baseplate multidomain protein megatron n=1 Tax=Tropicimonas sp. IMCC34043 TaxID=2248760 RepID=UPI000E264B11|nr:glycoside hydrolase/phage tail family protein [Tropicimonas sp. IMCC34043]